MENENDIDYRIEKLEFERDEVEEEIEATEKTIEELKMMTDKIPIREINIKVCEFIKELENHKSNDEELKEQIEKDIIFVRGLEDK